MANNFADNPLILIIIAVIAASFGSFITAASWRLPRNEDILLAASHCPKCKAKLKFFDLLPIISWLISRGRCRYCHAKIGLRYLITEIITTLIFLGLYFKYGLGSEFIILSLLAVSLLILIISDFETYIIPDSTTIAAFILAIVYHFYVKSEWEEYILGSLFCLLIALALRYGFYFITKREGLGFGDVKFLPVAGLWLGFAALPVYFVLAGITGVLTGIIWRLIFENPEYPFGPALAMSMFALIIFPQLNLAFATKIAQLGLF